MLQLLRWHLDYRSIDAGVVSQVFGEVLFDVDGCWVQIVLYLLLHGLWLDLLG